MLEGRRPLNDVEDLLLVVVRVHSPRELLAGFEFVVDRRHVLGSDGSANVASLPVDPHRVRFAVEFFDVDSFHATTAFGWKKNPPVLGRLAVFK